MNKVAGVLLCLPLLIFLGVRQIMDIQFNRNCEGYLKRAADANTVELAKSQLQIAVSYIERSSLTEGYTSVIYRTPDEDIGFWYNNLRGSLDSLISMKADATDLEKSNMLIKLRETLLDHGEKGVHVTCPEGISIYPYNVFCMITAIFCSLLLIAGCFVYLREDYDF